MGLPASTKNAPRLQHQLALPIGAARKTLAAPIGKKRSRLFDVREAARLAA
jgi:hypothetical protein